MSTCRRASPWSRRARGRWKTTCPRHPRPVAGVSDVISVNVDLNEFDLLKIAASCEKLSEHPLAKAVVNKAHEAKIDIEEPQSFKMYPGKGVACLNSYGSIYAGNSKFLLENKIDVDVDSYLDALKNEGKASIIIALNGQIVGLIGLSDVIREDSKSMIDKLQCDGSRDQTADGRR